MVKKDSEATIKIAKTLAHVIGSRDIVGLLSDSITKTDAQSVILDFANVEFISRSAAHELLMLKEKLRSKNKKIIFKNTNKSVSGMLRIIAANRALPKSETPKRFKAEKIDISLLLKEVAV